MKKICPLIKDECAQHGCHFYVHILGNNPQTGVQEDRWDCTFTWLPILLIENSKEVRQGAAAVESFRNESVKNTAVVGSALLQLADVARTKGRLKQIK